MYCGWCKNYLGDEKVENPKTQSWMDSHRPKCAINKSKDKINYKCKFFIEKEKNNVKW
jgi:hypothetical protein